MALRRNENGEGESYIYTSLIPPEPSKLKNTKANAS